MREKDSYLIMSTVKSLQKEAVGKTRTKKCVVCGSPCEGSFCDPVVEVIDGENDVVKDCKAEDQEGHAW